ncbi:MAG: type II toxin-antitoxin system VapC family toxin [Pseudonocardia sp.]
MRLLLDTQTWLWMESSPELLAPDVRARLVDPGTALVLSAASSWEIAIKYAKGKLPLPQPPRDYIPSRMRLSGIDGLPITHAHALHVATLPHHHRDPFDRLLVAQAQLEKLPLVTSDPQIERYDVPVIRAD